MVTVCSCAGRSGKGRLTRQTHCPVGSGTVAVLPAVGTPKETELLGAVKRAGKASPRPVRRDGTGLKGRPAAGIGHAGAVEERHLRGG